MKKFDNQGARRLVFVLAVSSTLGFWGLVSRINQGQSVQADKGAQASGSVPPLQAENQFVLDLPPLPTLVPTFGPSTARLGAVAVPIQNPVTVSRPVAPMTGKIFLGGVKPSLSHSAPITFTGSSK